MEVEKAEKVAWRIKRNRCRSRTATWTLEVPHLAKESSCQRWIETWKTSVAFDFDKTVFVDFARHLRMKLDI